MSNWKHYEKVEIVGLYKKLGCYMGEYILKLRVLEEGSIFSSYHDIDIQSTVLQSQLNALKEGELERCYFAFGMRDIDFYKVSSGDYAITHSPHEGLNLQFILADGEFEKLIVNINSTII